MVIIDNHIAYIKEDDIVIAYITFPSVGDRVVNINHTITHPKHRGKGYAKILMDEVYLHLKKNKLKAIASCSYAAMYFKRNIDKQDVLKEELKWTNQ